MVWYLRVAKIYGEKALRRVKDLGLLDRRFKVERDDLSVFIPLSRKPDKREAGYLRADGLRFEVIERTPRIESESRPRSLVEALEDALPPYLLASLPRSFDLIGDIIVVDLPEELKPYKRTVGEGLMKLYPRVKTVLARSGAVEGEFRVRRFEVIAGRFETETVHREYGAVFHVDLAKVYFNPRLSYEHIRVARQVREGETILDMFAGVGPFSIHIARRVNRVKVYAVDLNPDAYTYLKRNIEANRVEGKVVPVLGDAAEVAEKLPGVFDRVIMNLPGGAWRFLGSACKALKPSGGIIHFYQFESDPDAESKALDKFRGLVEEAGRRVVEVLAVRRVRCIAARRYHIVVDGRVV